jgi:hypothetical protein
VPDGDLDSNNGERIRGGLQHLCAWVRWRGCERRHAQRRRLRHMLDMFICGC